MRRTRGPATGRTSHAGRAARRRRPPRLAIVGAGRLGTALASALAREEWPIAAIVARRLSTARALARRSGAGLATIDAVSAARSVDAMILAVPDRALPSLARALAKGLGPIRRRPGGSLVVLHTSGASDASVLGPLRARGCAVGSFHPLLSFPKEAAARSGTAARPLATLFAGAAVAIDGDPAAQRVARRLAATLGAHPLSVPAAQRARYHLAACFAANYVVTLVWEATRLLEESGIRPRRTLAALLPLIRSTVGNLESSGLPDALTGPVARGDDVTLARHAALLRRGDHLRRELHRRLVERTARLARESGVIDRAALRRIERAVLGG